jgi:hypothetical protein
MIVSLEILNIEFDLSLRFFFNLCRDLRKSGDRILLSGNASWIGIKDNLLSVLRGKGAWSGIVGGKLHRQFAPFGISIVDQHLNR